MKTIDRKILRNYLEKGEGGAVKGELREWFLANDVPEGVDGDALPDPVDEELYAFWERSLQNRSSSRRGHGRQYAALMRKLFGKQPAVKTFLRGVSRAAAILLIPVAIAVYLLTRAPAPESLKWVEAYAPYGQTRQVTLPDGSRAWLNSGTYIFYPESFGDVRQVLLCGEALMEVVKDEGKPFFVDTKKVNISVLGTRFNVRSYSEDRYVETSLIEGSIALSLKNDGNGEPLVVKPGERVLVENQTSEIIRERFDTANYSSWHEGYYSFNHKTLYEITRDMERIFDVKIVIHDTTLVDDRYFASFSHNWNVDQILKALNMNDTLHIERRGRVIEIYRSHTKK